MYTWVFEGHGRFSNTYTQNSYKRYMHSAFAHTTLWAPLFKFLLIHTRLGQRGYRGRLAQPQLELLSSTNDAAAYPNEGGVRYAVTRVRVQETGVSNILVGIHDAILGQMSALMSGNCDRGSR
jgi:hypothetical protein